MAWGEYANYFGLVSRGICGVLLGLERRPGLDRILQVLSGQPRASSFQSPGAMQGVRGKRGAVKGFSCRLNPATLRKDFVTMSIHPIMQKLAAKLERTDLPDFAPGDTVRVQVKIKEGDKERLQAFEGMVIACRKGPQGSFTVRKMSFGQGVERIFPYNSKVVDKVEKIRSYQVRRAKLFYLRGLRGKAARLREVERTA